ncbi:DUF5689 domain-containing protein [Robiginitalea sp. IMCC43444]|uniref:DUF5689 domain-containing protein n=1 Tax=Robiginitalea sp. IMCC43444 TaxID=3459121 RepID=UPI004042C0A4
MILSTLSVLFLACNPFPDNSLPERDCNSFEGPLMPVEKLRELTSEGLIEIREDWVLEGYVVSSDLTGNIFGSLYIQDHPSSPEFGVEIKSDLLDLHTIYPLGSKVIVSLKGLYLGKRGKGLVLGAVRNSFGNLIPDRLPALATLEHLRLSCDSRIDPTPVIRTLSDLDSTCLHTLIRLEEMEILEAFKDGEYGDFEDGITMQNCQEERIVLQNSSFADFAGLPLPSGNGSVTGILTQSGNEFQMLIRDLKDLDLSGPDCDALYPLLDSDSLFISELADPDNELQARFLELYNASDKTLDLRGWTLRRFTNANLETGAEVTLEGLTIGGKSTLVFSAFPETFKSIYGFEPDVIAQANGPADSNGDDNLQLVNPFGEVKDTFGRIGEDGSNTDHEFEDGRAVRRDSVKTSSPVYVPDEWEIYNDTGAAGTTNLPQMAPADYSPGNHL